MQNYYRFTEINSPAEFNAMALAIFQRQYRANVVYRAYCDLLNIAESEVNAVEKIPFLPIQFFKSHRVVSFSGLEEQTFTSSGTTSSQNAQHHLKNTVLYRESFKVAFRQNYGPPDQWTILSLLPSYLEREGSSLIYMMKDLMEESTCSESGFYLNEWAHLNQTLQQLESRQQPTLLLGVSFALLDFVERFPQQLKTTIVMETGGMKGRRKELTREALHGQLKKGFGCSEIHSEYGMTELLSQAYAKKEGRFFCPPWMRVIPREINDPFARVEPKKTGQLNIIDLANQDSCAFIATDDLGRTLPDGSFEVLGRIDHSDIRGCNLMVY